MENIRKMLNVDNILKMINVRNIPNVSTVTKMIKSYQDIILVFVVLLVIHRFIEKSYVMESMAPINHTNMKHWQAGDVSPDSNDIISLRNNEMNVAGFDNLDITDSEYSKSNYNPAHLDQNSNESVYTVYEGDVGAVKPDQFNNFTYY